MEKKKYVYYIRFSINGEIGGRTLEGQGSTEATVIGHKISSMQDINNLAAAIKNNSNLPESANVLIDFYSLLRTE